MSAVKHVYRDETWSTKFFTYDPKPKEFLGRMGTTKFFVHMPSLLTLFELFWPFNLLCKIVIETNRYTSQVVDALGNTRGGPKWVQTSVAELKAFLAIHMYMGMRRQLNIKSYWSKKGSLFHCPTISNIMTRDRFMELRRCLHLTNPATYENIQKEDPGYVDEIRNACMREWSLGKFVTIEEMMVRYRGSYCSIRQYMPKKPKKWEIKFWVLTDSVSKFIYCFDIYCGKNLEAEIIVPGPSVQAGAAYGVVMKLLSGLEGKGHCVVMDNFFCSIPLFRDLEAKGIYATGTVRSN
jgi:hypothetical protein